MAIKVICLIHKVALGYKFLDLHWKYVYMCVSFSKIQWGYYDAYDDFR